MFSCDDRFLEHASDIGAMLQLWIAVASSLPYSNDVGMEVVHALLKMAQKDNLRRHIPAIAWEWLKKRPILLSRPWNFKRESINIVMQTVRKLRDIELTASLLFIIIRSMGDELYPPVCEEMLRISWEGLNEMGYRADLVRLLDDTMSRFEGWNPVKQRYEVLKSEMGKQEAEILAGVSSSVAAYFHTLTYSGVCRASLCLHVCPPSSLPIAVREPLCTPLSRFELKSTLPLNLSSLYHSYLLKVCS